MNENKLLAFHGKQEVKDFYLARVRAHREADEIIRGLYWENGKGCAVGCTVHSSSHAAYEPELGIPTILAKLEDNIFESLTNGRSKLWPEQFLSAPKVGADLSLVWPKFAIWLLTDPKFGTIQFAKSKQSKKSIQDVADAYQKVVDGSAKRIDWLKLRNDAYAAAAAAAAAAYAYAAAAAAAYAADAYAADAAAAAYAAAARKTFRNAQADKLIEIMSEAK